jgi:hypothetical protein
MYFPRGHGYGDGMDVEDAVGADVNKVRNLREQGLGGLTRTEGSSDDLAGLDVVDEDAVE